jgi:nucleoside 2-deoxyribosyltransferase
MRKSAFIYLASPLFNLRERTFNEEIAARLEPCGGVFLPQRDGALLVDMLLSGVPKVVAERRVFEQDCEAMRAASLLVAVLDGGHIDEGVAFEVGFMSALGKPSVGLQTDVRRALPSGNNPMISQSLVEIMDELGALVAWVENYIGSNLVRQPFALNVFADGVYRG